MRKDTLLGLLRVNIERHRPGNLGCGAGILTAVVLQRPRTIDPKQKPKTKHPKP